MNSKKLLQIIIVALLIGFFVVSCGAPATAPVAEAPAATATPIPPPPTPQPTLPPQPTTPALPQSVVFGTVWGSSDRDIFIVGELGTILHYDGSAWALMESGTLNQLYTVWGNSGSDVFAVGDNGTILHYDGNAWSPMKSGLPLTALVGVWGSSGRDVFAVGEEGTILHYDGSAWLPMSSGTSNTLITVWGSSGSDVFAVGRPGTILYYNGSAWSVMNSDTNNDLYGVWGSSGNDVFVAGFGGTILHYDGSVWTAMNSGTHDEFISVWGSSSSNIFVVGRTHKILHYDGRTWSRMPSDASHNLECVWGSSGKNVFAVGWEGTILHNDGKAWSDMSSGTPVALPAAEVPSVKILFIGDSLISWNNGFDQHLEQLAASANPPLAIEANTVAISYGSLEKIWQESNAVEVIGAGDYDAVVLQENLWATDVATFHAYARKFEAEIKKTGAKTVLFMPWQINYLELTTAQIAQAHRDIAAEVGAEVAPVGLAWQRALAERPELKLVEVDGIHPSIYGTYLATTVVYATLFGQSPNSTAYLPAAPSHDCATEEKEEQPDDPALDAYRVGQVRGCMTEEEAAFLQRIAWETVQEYTAEAAPVANQPASQPAPLTSYNLNSVWASSESDVFAVGELGTIVHYDGSVWSPMESRTVKNFTGVWGSSSNDVFATGTGGAILHYDGAAWSKMDSGFPFWIAGVWGSSGSDVFAAGEGGMILHYDGAAWSPVFSGVFDTLTSVWGSSGSDVFVVGAEGRILHYDGQTWLPQESGTSEQLWNVWGSSNQDVFAVGEFGTILHYDGQTWSAQESGTAEKLSSVWGSSGSDVFVSGAAGTLLHYDGQAWSPMNSGVTVQEIAGVRGSSGSDVFAVGSEGTILHYDGSTWGDMSSGTLAAAPVAKPTLPAKGELIREKITSQALAGNLIGDPAERGYYVYLPPSYVEGNKRYPVVHILHGATGNEDQFLMLKDVYEKMLQKGAVQEIILVFSDGDNKFKASNYLSSPTIGDYETYIARELVAQIDANYRTMPHRDSRGITGCSMGGSGAMHLALNFPDVYNVVVPISASYDLANDPSLPEAAADFTQVPKDFNDLDHYWYVGVGNIAYYISLAAGAAPNPAKPPFYLDMPFEIVDGQGRIVPEVLEKIGAVDVVHDLEDYLQQPIRLRHIMLYHGESDLEAPIELARSFDQLLTSRNVDHQYIEFKSGHCDYSTDYQPVFQYLSDHLVAEQMAQGTVELKREKITSQALAGNLLGDPAERRVFVVLPPGYATSDKRYPVLYLLPWADGEPGDNASGFKWTMQSLLRKGEIGEMIVVVPDGSNTLGASHFRSSPTIGDYETYVTQEVVNYMDTHYRTLPTRDSRGLAGCSNGGGPAMRLAFKYPNVFSVAAPTDGIYDESLEVWPSDVEAVQQLKELPWDSISLKLHETVARYVQMAAGSAPDPNNPPFYSEMPVRIVNGQGEFVPEVIAKIVEKDAAHEARRYVEQPLRLRGILIRHALQDTDYTQATHSFEQLLTDLGIEHEYVEVEGNHCGYGWEAASLKYMSEKLVFEE
jgi:enterochelin esterase-like enzyme